MMRRFLPFLFLIVGFGCSENAEDTKAANQEVLPKVNKKDFKTITAGGYQFQLHKTMSLDSKDAREIVAASYLPNEFHVTVQKVPVNSYSKDPAFPKAKDQQLDWFTKQYIKRTQEQMASFKSAVVKKTFVGDQSCRKINFTGRSFGFPIEKQIFIRCYQFANEFIVVHGWTFEANAKRFEPIIQYMGMTLKPLKN